MNWLNLKFKPYFLSGLFFLLALAPLIAADLKPNKFFVLNPNEQFLIRVFDLNGSTNIRLFETKEMNQVSQWKIADFNPHTVRFSDVNPNLLLLASEDRIITYNIQNGKGTLTFEHLVAEPKKIKQISFDRESDDIIWTTDYTVHKTSPKENKTIQIGFVDQSKGPIKTLSVLKGHKIAVGQEKSSDIHIFSPGYQKAGKKVSEHKAPIVGIQSPKGQTIYSVDKELSVLIWDIFTKQILNQANLPQPDIDSEIIATGLDDKRENLLVVHQIGDDQYGEKYSLKDLKNGLVAPEKRAISGKKSGQLHSANAILSSDYSHIDAVSEEAKKQISTFVIPDPPKKKTTAYQLAVIEAQNENYYMALDFIKQVDADDPEYKQSRELQKELYNKIEALNKINAAKEQYADHSYESAKILLNEALDKDPESKQAKKYMDLVNQQLSSAFWNKIIIATIIIIILGLIGFLIYRFKFAPQQSKSPHQEPETDNKAEKTTSGGDNISEAKLLRQEFITTRNQTREILKRAILMDKMKKYKIKWIEYASQIKLIEKKAKQSGKKLPELIEQLKMLQKSIRNISWHKFKRSQRSSTYRPKNNTNQQSQEHQSDKKQEEPLSEKSSGSEQFNYYKILNVSENASSEDIKNAFRAKMKEYHPDRHNASDFKWVKEEAARMTQLIQEAYEILSDPTKRKSYTP